MLAMQVELAEPYPFTKVTRGQVVDELLEQIAGTASDRERRLAWAVAAGGDV